MITFTSYREILTTGNNVYSYLGYNDISGISVKKHYKSPKSY